jgi:hypothetical protein
VSGPVAAALVAAAATIGARGPIALRGADAGGLRPALIRRAAALLRLTGRARRALLLGRTILLWRARLLIAALPIAAWLPFARWAWRPFAARSDRGERDATAIFIDIDNPDFEHIAYADYFVWIANKAVGQPANVHQATVGEADIDEYAEVNDIENGAGKLHARRQILELHDAAAEDRRRQIVARVQSRTSERRQDVLQ